MISLSLFVTLLLDNPHIGRPTWYSTISPLTLEERLCEPALRPDVARTREHATFSKYCSKELYKWMGSRLHDLVTMARGGQDTGSHNLRPVVLRNSVHLMSTVKALPNPQWSFPFSLLPRWRWGAREGSAFATTSLVFLVTLTAHTTIEPNFSWLLKYGA